jgi:hypothetical protein
MISNRHLVVAGDDVIDGQADQAGDGLRVKQQQASGHPGAERDALVGQETVQHGEAAMLADRGPARLFHRGDVEAGHVMAGHGPFQEAAQDFRLGLRGVPGVNIGLHDVR